jgi:hypothetical protein
MPPRIADSMATQGRAFWGTGHARPETGAVTGSDNVRNELGVYLLGAISRTERASVEEHLSSCRECQKELAGLAVLPSLLGKLNAGEMRALVDKGGDQPTDQQADGRLNRSATRVAGRRRRRVWAVAAAAAVTLVAAAGTTQWLKIETSRPNVPLSQPWTAQAQGFDSQTRAGVTIRYSPRRWGTELDVHVTGIRPGTICQFWVTTAQGKKMAAGGWSIASTRPATWYPASVASPTTNLRSFEVTTGRTILVTAPIQQ